MYYSMMRMSSSLLTISWIFILILCHGTDYIWEYYRDAESYQITHEGIVNAISISKNPDHNCHEHWVLAQDVARGGS